MKLEDIFKKVGNKTVISGEELKPEKKFLDLEIDDGTYGKMMEDMETEIFYSFLNKIPSLSEKEKNIIKKRRDDMTLREIGNYYNVCPERIKNILAKAEEKIRDEIKKREKNIEKLIKNKSHI